MTRLQRLKRIKAIEAVRLEAVTTKEEARLSAIYEAMTDEELSALWGEFEASLAPRPDLDDLSDEELITRMNRLLEWSA